MNTIVRYPAGTTIRCRRCDITVATFRIARTSLDPVDRDDVIFPGKWPLPALGAPLICPDPKCRGHVHIPDGILTHLIEAPK